MSPPVPEVTVQEAADAAAGNSVLLLDVREDDEWEAGHAQGAVHVPLASVDATGFQADVPVVAVCRSGNRSGKAAELLARGGIDVVNMAGGMTAWAAAGLPVVAADGSPGEIV
jgi:rhodanese-related sulfurtransferase